MKTNSQVTTAHVAVMLSTFRIRFAHECDMQVDVEEVLNHWGLECQREYVLSKQDTIDFWLPESGIGVECKVAGGPSAVLAQLLRYAEHDCVSGLILVTRRRTHNWGVETLGGKPFAVVWVAGEL